MVSSAALSSQKFCIGPNKSDNKNATYETYTWSSVPTSTWNIGANRAGTICDTCSAKWDSG